jgi:hypothetical protein
MLTTIFSKRRALLLFVVTLLPAAAVLAQDSEEAESDEAFLSRMQAEFRRIDLWVENMDAAVQQKMGMTSASGNRIGVNNGMSPSRMGSDPMNSDLRRARLDLRSMTKEVAKELALMERQYGVRDSEGFDRSHWRTVVRRFDTELREMQRDLQRL